MLGRFDLRPSAVIWFLLTTALIGGGIRAYRAWVGPRELPEIVVKQPTSEAAALVDSIANVRRARMHRPIAVNSATAEELERLPGIGPVLAKNIIKERERGGLFRSLDELTRVSGIGPKRLSQIRDQCVLNLDTTKVDSTSSP